MTRKMITVNCDNCGQSYEKAESEYKRNERLGRKSFCCRSCSISYNNKNRVTKSISESQIKHLASIQSNRRDEFTPYRYSLRCAKRRFKECNISLDDLKEIWESQKGICPYTGIKLILPEDGNIDLINVEERASLDRIDSSLGYIKGNIQFVSTPINYMKNSMSDLGTKRFLKRISYYASNFLED